MRLAQALGAQVKSDRLDVAEREAVLAHADAVVAHFGTVHQVYNNAGIAYNGNVDKSEFKDIERIIDVDFWGVVNGTKAFLPHVIASGDGHIVNISSLFGLIAVPGKAPTTRPSSRCAASPRRCARRCWSPGIRSR